MDLNKKSNLFISVILSRVVLQLISFCCFAWLFSQETKSIKKQRSIQPSTAKQPAIPQQQQQLEQQLQQQQNLIKKVNLNLIRCWLAGSALVSSCHHISRFLQRELIID